MQTFSTAFKLNKKQPQLDFVDIPLGTDIWLFIDPFALRQRPDRWSQQAHQTLVAFFQRVVDAIRSGQLDEAKRLLSYLREPNETRLGLSKGKPQGSGIGPGKALQLFDALRESSAVQTGFLSSLEECELMIDGISNDNVSDLTTNVIRSHLIEYTQRQCDLHSVPTQNVAVSPCFNANTLAWESVYAELPVWRGSPIILVPKAIVRTDTAYNHQKYYRHYVLNFLRAEELNAGSSLVRTLKDGTQWVAKKDVQNKYPCSKEFLYRFSRSNPGVLDAYRQSLERLEKRDRNSPVDDVDETAIINALITALQGIPPGANDYAEYHRLMIGIVEVIFFPHLMNPTKEREIHDGRKRIDIFMENGAYDGIFHRLNVVRKIPCTFIPFECKNYLTEVANPELDQLAGRFSANRGQVGFLCCRQFEDRALFLTRCKDTYQDGRGIIVPLDDTTVISLLEMVRDKKISELDRALTDFINEVCA